MGQQTPTSGDDVNKLSAGDLEAVGETTAWVQMIGRINFSVWGDFVGSVVVERSFDGGLTAIPGGDASGPAVFGEPVSTVLEAPESWVYYRVRCVAFSSGVISVRLSQ